MTFNEFKSWLEGFSEAIGDAPTPEQWAKVKAKMGEVHAPQPVTIPNLPNIYPPRYDFDTQRTTPFPPNFFGPIVRCNSSGAN